MLLFIYYNNININFFEKHLNMYKPSFSLELFVEFWLGSKESGSTPAPVFTAAVSLLDVPLPSKVSKLLDRNPLTIINFNRETI